MTKTGLTEIVFVIDRSGSMQTIRDDVIGGTNKFLTDQQNQPGDAVMTYIQFDHEFQQVFEAKPIQDVQPLDEHTYVPRGNTALLGAVGLAIETVGSRLHNTPESERPERVIFVVQTDGAENSSRRHEWSKRFDQEEVKRLIERQQDEWNWEFIFLGANIDAHAVGASIGLRAHNLANFKATPQGTVDSYLIASQSVSSYRTTGSTLAKGQSSIAEHLDSTADTEASDVS